MQNKILILYLLIFLSCDFKSANSYYEDAYILEENGKYEEAIKLLDKAIAKNPKFLGAYINRGVDKSILGRKAEAIKDYNKVIEIDPENVLALFNKANNLHEIKKYNEAIGLYDKIMNLKGGEPLTINWTQNPYFKNEKADYDVNSFDIIFRRAVSYYHIDKLNKSYEGFEISINNNYKVKEAYFYLGGIYYAMDEGDKACEYFKKSMKLGDYDAQEFYLKNCK